MFFSATELTVGESVFSHLWVFSCLVSENIAVGHDPGVFMIIACVCVYVYNMLKSSEFIVSVN